MCTPFVHFGKTPALKRRKFGSDFTNTINRQPTGAKFSVFKQKHLTTPSCNSQRTQKQPVSKALNFERVSSTPDVPSFGGSWNPRLIPDTPNTPAFPGFAMRPTLSKPMISLPEIDLEHVGSELDDSVIIMGSDDEPESPNRTINMTLEGPVKILPVSPIDHIAEPCSDSLSSATYAELCAEATNEHNMSEMSDGVELAGPKWEPNDYPEWMDVSDDVVFKTPYSMNVNKLPAVHIDLKFNMNLVTPFKTVMYKPLKIDMPEDDLCFTDVGSIEVAV